MYIYDLYCVYTNIRTKYAIVKLTIVIIIIIYVSSHSLMYVEYVGLLYQLSTIINKAGYHYPSNTMCSHAAYAFTQFY